MSMDEVQLAAVRMSEVLEDLEVHGNEVIRLRELLDKATEREQAASLRAMEARKVLVEATRNVHKLVLMGIE